MTTGDNRTPQQRFEDNVADRIRSEIGELMPHDILAGMVSKVIEDSFLKKSPIVDRWGSKIGEGNPKLYSIVQEVTRPMIVEAVDKWVSENQDTLGELIAEAVKQASLESIIKIVSEKFNTIQYDFARKVADMLKTGNF